MTIAELKEQIAQVLQETFGPEEFFTDDEINGYIDDAFVEVTLKVPELDYLSLLDKYEDTFPVDVHTYEIDLKNQLQGFFKLSHLSMPNTFIRPVTPEEYDASLNNAFWKPTKAEPVYFIEGTKLKISIGDELFDMPMPFTLHYYKLPSVSVNSTIDDKFVPLIKAFVLYRAYMKNNDYNQADRYYKQYQEDIVQLKQIYGAAQ